MRPLAGPTTGDTGCPHRGAGPVRGPPDARTGGDQERSPLASSLQDLGPGVGMRSGLLVLVMVLALASAAPPAHAITLSEIVALSRAGLADEVLLALIEVEARVFSIDADTIAWLHESGVRPRVIEAIVRSGRSPRVDERAQPAAPPAGLPPEPAEVAVPPRVIVIERAAPAVVVAVPVYVAAPVVGVSRRRVARRAVESARPVVSTGFNTTVVSTGFGARPAARPPSGAPAAQSVYWGWGGRLRPDAWKPAWEAAGPRRVVAASPLCYKAGPAVVVAHSPR